MNNGSVKAGLVKDGEEEVGLHDLRHSLAAYAFEQKMSPVKIARLLRHANPQVTLTVYAGLAGDQVEELAESLAGIGTAS